MNAQWRARERGYGDVNKEGRKKEISNDPCPESDRGAGTAGGDWNTGPRDVTAIKTQCHEPHFVTSSSQVVTEEEVERV